MSSSVIETLRSANEEVECLEKALAIALHYKEDHPRESVVAERIVKKIMNKIQAKSIEILDVYLDYDNRRKTENEIFSGQRFVSDEHMRKVTNQSGVQNPHPDVWDNFNEKCREVHEFVDRYTKIDEIAPISNLDSQSMFEYLLGEELKDCDKIFPYNNEKRGKYVDLQRNFSEYQNLKMKKNEKPYSDDYISYIENFERFDEIPVFAKKNTYKAYLENLLEYLVNFFKNSKPLTDHSKLTLDMEARFEEEWKNGSMPGWEEELKKLRVENVGDKKILY